MNRQWTRYGAGAMLVATVAGCDNLLEVDLPTAVTEEALASPGTAGLQVNSIMAAVECAYSSLALDAAGYEDNFQRVSGVAGAYSEYRTTPAPSGADLCDTGAYSSLWIEPMLVARASGKQTYERLTNWTDAQVPNRQQLLAQAAIYTSIPLEVLGEFFCEATVDAGPLMTPTQTLDLGVEWVNKALGHIDQGGDFAIRTQQGQVATSARQMALGLRARMKWAKGDLAGAAADAALVNDGFMAFVLREEGEDRKNLVSSVQGGGGGTQAAGFLQGPITLKSPTNRYGVNNLGVNPATGQQWPDPVPFTGYLNLGILQNGLAVTDAGYPITTDAAGAVRDTRVSHRIGNTAGGPDNIISKYTSLSDDIPLVNWREMRLIQAQHQNEVVGNQRAAIALINQLRTAAGLPIIAAEVAATASQDFVEDMIIEERRRALWLEARFWSTKIQNTDKLWFPRQQSSWVNPGAVYQLEGGVRLLLPADEYQINSNLGMAKRGTGCSGAEKPVF